MNDSMRDNGRMWDEYDKALNEIDELKEGLERMLKERNHYQDLYVAENTKVATLREALERFAKIDLTGEIGEAIAWDILNARAVLKISDS